MEQYPKARTSNIITQQSGDELLVYDLETNLAFLLNDTCLLVWQKCDGTNGIGEIAADLSEEVTWLALDTLQRYGLLESNGFKNRPVRGMSRREAVRAVGISSMIALPMVTALLAPPATQAQSVASACCAKFIGSTPVQVTAGTPGGFSALVRIVDVSDNTVTSPDYFVFLTSSDPQFSYSSPGLSTSGERNMTNIQLRTAGPQTITANASGLPLGDTRNIQVNPGPFAQCLGGFPRDQFGNIIPPGPGVPVCPP
jgi:hypothetical protein